MSAHILVVDDDKDHAESIADLLELRGYAVEVAHSGENALELFRRRHFDLTLMDVKLPGMSGVATFFQLRKARPGAPVIMMTGLSLEQLIASAVENGTAEILRSPCAMRDVLNAVTLVRPGGLVLVVNSEPALARSISEFLDASGCSTAAVRSQSDLRRAIARQPDCLILDVVPSIVGGVEAYLEFRARGGLVPAVLLTSCNDQVAEQLVRENILIKPFDPALLIEAIKSALEPRRVEAA